MIEDDKTSVDSSEKSPGPLTHINSICCLLHIPRKRMSHKLSEVFDGGFWTGLEKIYAELFRYGENGKQQRVKGVVILTVTQQTVISP